MLLIAFVYYYDDPNEQAIYNNYPWKEQIEELKNPQQKKKPETTKTPEPTPPVSPPLSPTLTLSEYLKKLEQESNKYVEKGTIPWIAPENFATYWNRVKSLQWCYCFKSRFKKPIAKNRTPKVFFYNK